MKPLIVYQSRTGNTRAIAEAMATALGADILPADQVTAKELASRPLVGLGSGLYWGKLDARIHALAASRSGAGGTFVFFTNGIGLSAIVRQYHHTVRKALLQVGLTPLGIWNCRGYDQHPMMRWMGIGKGRPNAADFEDARRFALQMQRPA